MLRAWSKKGIAMTSSIRSASIGFLACFLALAAVSTAHAHNNLTGSWVARLPGGAVSSYTFGPGVVHADDSIHGRFQHTFVDDRGVQHTVQGGYILVPTIANRGRLTLRFDDGLIVKDVEHGGANFLQLRHVGLNRNITYFRQ
jgi:hypothetical protein